MIRPQAPSPLGAETPEEIAARWAVKRAERPLRVREQRELDTWIQADAGNAEAFARAAHAYDLAGEFASSPDILNLRREALSLEGKRFDPRPWALAAAACLALAVLGLWRFGAGVPAQDLAQAPAPGFEHAAEPRDHYETQVGERLTATLSDGSTVTLNTDSEVRIDYDDGARRIELIRGQAFFTVAHHDDWPFLVEAGGRSVRALGTQFDVRLDQASLEVVLVEGRVAVGAPAALAQGDLRQAVELQAGERLVAARSAVEVAPVNAETATSWRTGRVYFAATPLAEAIAEINRYRTRPLVIEDPDVAALQISGAFRTADAQSFGQALTASVPVEERALPDGRALLVHRSAGE